MSIGISGYLTKSSILSPLTPLFLMASIVLGFMALVAIPREEEPQISVPMIDIAVMADGLKAPDAAELVTKPLEAIVKSVSDVEHVYSQTMDDRVMVTARFDVGTDPDDAVLRIHEKIKGNYDKMPVGIPEPLIVGRGINDVAIVTLTLTPKTAIADKWTDAALADLAEKLRSEIVKIEDIGLTYVSGGNPDEIRVEPDPEKLAAYGVTLQQLIGKIQQANRSFDAGAVYKDSTYHNVKVGKTLNGVPDIGLLLLTTQDGRPVYVKDVANLVVGPRPASARVSMFEKTDGGQFTNKPAVTLAIAKRAGANAVVIADEVLDRVETLKGVLVPDDVDVIVTRNYGETANDKANELLFHLGLATVSIVLLIGWAIGRVEGAVTFVVIPTTIMLTLFASWLLGYTINRVSLFALIFSIGILVDDAVVMVENISRHWAMKDGRTRIEATIDAVAEVGNPTILATLTVVTALLPMLFVGGLMGPYMAPIPVNASIAMLISFVVAVTIAPWLMRKLSDRFAHGDAGHHPDPAHDKIGEIFRHFARPVIATREKSRKFLIIVGIATLASMVLFATKSVVVKLLPFDNKPELSIIFDLPEGSTVEDTERAMVISAQRLAGVEEIVDLQGYAGTAAPFNFNGLVRHYFYRSQPDMGELQVNLTPKDERDRTSHEIALEVRGLLKDVPLPAGSSYKVVEVPPGPPVMSTLLAEVYGPDSETRRAVMLKVEEIFKSVPFIVDVDNSIGERRPQWRVEIDQDQLEYFGVEQKDVYDTVSYLMNGAVVGYSHRGEGRDPLDIAVRLPKSGLSWNEYLASISVPAITPSGKGAVELGNVVSARHEEGSYPIYRRDGYFSEMVTAELAGDYEAPIYGIFAVNDAIDEMDWGNLPKPEVKFHGQPLDENAVTLLWDGEWEITYVTFRDMGIAFMAALLGIYILVVAQFRSFTLPLVILTPVPLTLIGILIGHWMFGAAFTATSMIGFIALAGIIVRNSILLVDFIRQRRAQGNASLREVLLEAGAIRARPILLTALAAMIGAAVILADPIFQGLAISLLFGLISSTLLTLLVIPAVYIVMRDDGIPLKDERL